MCRFSPQKVVCLGYGCAVVECVARRMATYHVGTGPTSSLVCVNFYTPQLHRQVLLRVRISYGNSVCLSVTTRYGFKAR